MKKEQPSYYAIIPANVRYDKHIPAGAKLLYGEVTALSNQKGYCFASNGYFSELYGCTPQAISKWFKRLEAAGYVRISYHGEPGNQERRVSISVESYQPQLRGLSTTVEGLSTTVEHNNTSILIQERIREGAPQQSETLTGLEKSPPPCSAPPPAPNRTRFSPPPVEEVSEYLEDLFLDPKWQRSFLSNPPETAEEIHDYYTSNGWKVGRNPMKDWRAACRNWLKNNRTYATKQRSNVSSAPGPERRIVSEDTHRRALAITLAELGITSGQ